VGGPPALRTRLWALERIAQVLGRRAGERLQRRRVLRAQDVPRVPADITPQWLTAVLCRNRPEARVRSVSATRGSVGTTTRAALEVAYGDGASSAGLPTHLFVKCTSGVAQRLMLGLGGFIAGEPGFYSSVRPTVNIEAPAGYYGGVDQRSWRSAVVIEDVAVTRGARFWEPARRITREQIEDLLGNVAEWHGALWESKRLAQWRWLRTPADHMRLIDALLGLADRTWAGAERAQAVIPATLRRRQADLRPAMRASMQIASAGAHTYLHGDLHVANTYLTADGRMGVADWQIGLRGSWAYDYAYILATALSVEDRRAWERELLDIYLERLAGAGGPVLGAELAWLAYRQATFYPSFAWLYTLGRSRLQPNFQPAAVALTLIERIAAAIDDLDSFAAVGL